MARRRPLEPIRTGDLPPELTSRHHETWTDARAVEALFEAFGLEAPPHARQGVAGMAWWARFDAFRVAWCQVNGLMDARWDGRIDLGRCREAGVDTSSSSRYRLRTQERA